MNGDSLKELIRRENTVRSPEEQLYDKKVGKYTVPEDPEDFGLLAQGIIGYNPVLRSWINGMDKVQEPRTEEPVRFTIYTNPLSLGALVQRELGYDPALTGWIRRMTKPLAALKGPVEPSNTLRLVAEQAAYREEQVAKGVEMLRVILESDPFLNNEKPKLLYRSG